MSMLNKPRSDSYTAEITASAMLRIERQTDQCASCTIDMDGRLQRVALQAEPRHYGGCSGISSARI
jgi:hypothetical protein